MIPDRSHSRAILIAVSAYTDSRYRDVPAAANSLRAMSTMLVEAGGWAPEQITVLDNPTDCRHVSSLLRRTAGQTLDTLLVYYVGHGAISSEQHLCLTLADTDFDDPDTSGVEYSRIRTAFRSSPASVKIAILDCCFSGRAIEALSGAEAASLTAVSGAFVLTASDGYQAAHVPPPLRQVDACTSFTGELVDVVERGIAGGPATLTLDAIYQRLRRQLIERGLPEPNCSATDTAATYPFVMNRYTEAPGEASASAVASATALHRPESWRRSFDTGIGTLSICAPDFHDAVDVWSSVPQWLRDFAILATDPPPQYPNDQERDVEEDNHDGVPLLASELDDDALQALLSLSRYRWANLKRRLVDSGRSMYDLEEQKWHVASTLRRVARIEPGLVNRIPRLWRPAQPTDHAELRAAIERNGYFLHLWRAGEDSLCVVYPCGARLRHPRDLVQLLRPLPFVPNSVVFVADDYGVWGPELVATDLERPELRYKVRWTDLSERLGMPVPWWPRALRRPTQMAQWRPDGRAVATYEVTCIRDVNPLIQLADAEREGSTARVAAISLAAELRDRTIVSADTDLEIVASNGDRWKGLFVPVKPNRAGAESRAGVPEKLLRKGWGVIVNRSDRLAYACTDLALQWDYGEHFPYGTDVTVGKPDDPIAVEWISRLVPSVPTASLTRFDVKSLTRVMRDPLTDLPVVQTTGYYLGHSPDRVVYHTVAPLQLPTSSPLAQLILDDVIWIRTANGALFPAPRRVHAGISFGYRGTGPHILAILIDRLLDDISAEAADYTGYEAISVGLLEGTTGDWQDGDVLTRDQLLITRQRSATTG